MLGTAFSNDDDVADDDNGDVLMLMVKISLQLNLSPLDGGLTVNFPLWCGRFRGFIMYGTNDGAKRYLVFNVPFSHLPPQGGGDGTTRRQGGPYTYTFSSTRSGGTRFRGVFYLIN